MAAFNPAKSKLKFQLTFEGSWPTAVAFLGSGNRIAAANQLGHIFIWELPDKAPSLDPKAGKDRQAPDVPPVRRLDGHQNEITRLAASPDGKRLVSASLDRTVRVWKTDAAAFGKAEVILDADARKREARRSGKKELSSTPGVSVQTLTECQVLEGHSDWIHALGVTPDCTRAITGDAVSQVIVWDLNAGKSIAKWSGFPWNWIVSASLTAEGQTALVSEYRYKRDDFDIPTPALKTWDVATGKEKLDILKVQFPKINPLDRTYGGAQVWRKFVANGLITSAFSPDGKLIAVGQGGETDTGKVHLLDASSGKLLRSISNHQYGVTDVMFSPDGKYLISAGRDTTARISQVSDGKEVAALGAPRGGQFKDWLSAIALSPDNKCFAAADIAGMVHVWEFTG